MSETEAKTEPSNPPQPADAATTPAPSRPLSPEEQKILDELPREQREEIVRLKQVGYGSRRIVPRLHLPRRVVTAVLQQEGVSSPAPASHESKLALYLELVEAKVKEGLTASRILREIQEAGYKGSRTILAEKVCALRPTLTLAPKKKRKRRFETPPGKEMQIDWSPFWVTIAEERVLVHVLACLLCASRKLFLRFFRDERQPTLLQGLAESFEYFQGCAQRLVMDNMTTAVLGRIGPDRKVLWHQRLLDFSTHYGFEPFACAVMDPDRKGKDEKVFRLVWDDLLKGTRFQSWDDLDARRRVWLDETPGCGNRRVHGTTRQVPNEAWQEERELLIRLPAQRFAVHEQSVRLVDADSTLSVRGTRYTVPATLANRAAAVRLFAEHFEVLDQDGHIAFSRRYVADADKGKLIIEPTHYALLPRRRNDGGSGGERLDEAFGRRFPALLPLVDGLKQRMKTLAPIHLRALIRLADQYGEPDFLAAATRVMQYRRYDATAVRRILEQEHPLVIPESGSTLGSIGPAILGEVDSGSLDAYSRLDRDAPASPAREDEAPDSDKDDEEDDHGA